MKLCPNTFDTKLISCNGVRLKMLVTTDRMFGQLTGRIATLAGYTR